MSDTDRVESLFRQFSGDASESVPASKRELWSVVRRAGRPGADQEKSAVVTQLLGLLATDAPLTARRELLWILSEIGGDESVGAVAALLADVPLREDARMVLQRIPGKASLQALESGLKSVPEDFKINMAQSLRARGVKVSGYPCRKMTPTRKTKVTPVE